MNRLLSLLAFVLPVLAGLAAVAWVAAGYASAYPLPLAVTAVVGAFFVLGVAELHRYRQTSARLRQAAQAGPISAHDALPLLFKRPLDAHQTTFALGEAVAHLNRLWHAGQLVRTRDAQGVWRFALPLHGKKEKGHSRAPEKDLSLSF